MNDVPGVMYGKRINLGRGYALVGPANTSHNANDLQQIGAMDSQATILVKAGKKIFEAEGKKVEERITSQELRLEVTVRELSLDVVKMKLGWPGTIGSIAAGIVIVASEYKRLQGTNWHHLEGINVHEVDFTAQTATATPTSLTEDVDFEVHRARGLVRRLASGAIADGDYVDFGYKWNRPATQTLSGGTNSDPDYYPVRYVVPQKKDKRMIFDGYRMLPNGDESMDFKSDDWHGCKLVFDGFADPERDPDADVWKIWWETITT